LFQCKSTNHGKSLHYDIIFIVSVRRGFFFMLLYTILYFSAYEQLIPDNAMHVLQFSISSLHFVGRKICRVICISWIINYVHPYLIFLFFGNPGCPGQFTRTTTNPSNPGNRDKETLPLPLSQKPRFYLISF
jgi:hypothetical protein